MLKLRKNLLLYFFYTLLFVPLAGPRNCGSNRSNFVTQQQADSKISLSRNTGLEIPLTLEQEPPLKGSEPAIATADEHKKKPAVDPAKSATDGPTLATHYVSVASSGTTSFIPPSTSSSSTQPPQTRPPAVEIYNEARTKAISCINDQSSFFATYSEAVDKLKEATDVTDKVYYACLNLRAAAAEARSKCNQSSFDLSDANKLNQAINDFQANYQKNHIYRQDATLVDAMNSAEYTARNARFALSSNAAYIRIDALRSKLTASTSSFILGIMPEKIHTCINNAHKYCDEIVARAKNVDKESDQRKLAIMMWKTRLCGRIIDLYVYTLTAVQKGSVAIASKEDKDYLKAFAACEALETCHEDYDKNQLQMPTPLIASNDSPLFKYYTKIMVGSKRQSSDMYRELCKQYVWQITPFTIPASDVISHAADAILSFERSLRDYYNSHKPTRSSLSNDSFSCDYTNSVVVAKALSKGIYKHALQVAMLWAKKARNAIIYPSEVIGNFTDQVIGSFTDNNKKAGTGEATSRKTRNRIDY